MPKGGEIGGNKEQSKVSTDYTDNVNIIQILILPVIYIYI